MLEAAISMVSRMVHHHESQSQRACCTTMMSTGMPARCRYSSTLDGMMSRFACVMKPGPVGVTEVGGTARKR